MATKKQGSFRKSSGRKTVGTKKGTGGRATEIARTAREYFGFESLRPGQEEAVKALISGCDCVVVMPTGSGKSAIYQIAGSMMKGTTLVISPLIALQKDQVDSINETRAQNAVVINSTQSVSETRDALEKIEDGTGKFIFLAPEQLRKQETVEVLESANVSFLVVDEAHCISEWGHDFRPDYLEIGSAVQRLGHPVLLAMTATASPEVREEIVQRLDMRKPKLLVHGFDRPNIYLRVDRFQAGDEKMQALVTRVRWASKPGIVYVATRKNAEEIMGLLAEQGVDAVHYHGGLKASERTQIQEQFMSGGAEVIVATNAFGMGVDKADVRFVYHYDVSESLDSYYQEIGRAGRDGEKAEAVLFFRQEDLGVQKFRSAEGKLDPEQVKRLTDLITEQGGSMKPQEISEESNLPERKLATAIHRLEDVGALEVLPTGEVKLAEDADPEQTAAAAAEEQENRREMKRTRLRQMEEYVETSACRRKFLLNYFGDSYTGPCNNCDNCQALNPESSIDPALGTRKEVA
jgi:ATP-dependent DNA helicase RecQ